MLAPARPVRLSIVLAWMVLLTFWSSLSNLPFDHPPISTLLFGFQHRVAHVVAFGTLALLARWAFDGFPRAALLALLLTSAFGATDELHQRFTPHRHPGLDDWLVDTLAGGLAMLVWPRVFQGRAIVRTLAPAVVASLFVVGTLLGITATHARVPAGVRRATVQILPTEITHGARDLARSTRSFVARL
jgi:VanZ family protein